LMIEPIGRGVLDTPLGAFAKASAARRHTPAKPWRRRVAGYDDVSSGSRFTNRIMILSSRRHGIPVDAPAWELTR
jgi:hypothetical protein